MTDILNFLRGKKTYLGSIAIGVTGLLWSCGLLDDNTTIALGSIITALTGVAFRAAIKKVE